MNKLLFNGIILAVLMSFMASCQYKFIVEPVVPPPDPIDTIFFSQDIIPIWNDGNNCISCHKTGGTAPDLTPDNAFNAITNDGLIDTQDAAESVIYKFPHPDTDTHTWKKYTGTEAATVLQWIEQGALNN